MKSAHQDECVLCCHENVRIHASGACDHPVCFECSTRMRVLCETNECPICRSDMPLVVFTHKVQTFASVCDKFSLLSKKYQIAFEDIDICDHFDALLQNKCCKCEEVCPTFLKLAEHMRRKHELHYCDLCTDNLKIFNFERKCYSRKDLARHRRIGDSDDKSHKGHPLCEFCDQRYVDLDDLYRHLRKEHYFCHFCDIDGKHQYYKDYDFLRVHFRKDHYLCEEGDCVNERFTGAFRTEIDLKAHIAVHHTRNKSKAEAKQARMLDFEFSYVPHVRPTGSSSPRGGRYPQRRRNDENSSRDKEQSSQQQQPAEEEKIDTQSVQDFPYLSNDVVNPTTSAASQSVDTKTNSLSLRNPYPQRRTNFMSPDDFPALGVSSNTPSEAALTQFRNLISRPNAPPKAATAPHQLPAKKKTDKNMEGDKKNSKWNANKGPVNFEEDFPKLEVKKTKPPPVPAPPPAQRVKYPTPAAKTTTTTDPHSGEQFVTIKGKKTKKQNKVPQPDSDSDEAPYKSLSSLATSNSFSLLNQDAEKFKRHIVHPSEKQATPAPFQSDTWEVRVSFGNEDFPALPSSKPVRKPPGLNPTQSHKPPPGFSSKPSVVNNEPTCKMSLSSIARLIENKPNDQLQAESNGTDEIDKYIAREEKIENMYLKPPNYESRNMKLFERIHNILGSHSSKFSEFKVASEKFRFGDISADEYYSQCLNILGMKGFLDIIPELVVLLPDIHKQQKLLLVHDAFLSHRNIGGIGKSAKVARNLLVSCQSCNQVLVRQDCENHNNQHESARF